jgi:eukaryotic-like serine/threonine-protein kinase
VTAEANGQPEGGDEIDDRLVELVAGYHDLLVEGRSSPEDFDTAALDPDTRATFLRAQQVIAKLARVRPHFCESASGASGGPSDLGTNRLPLDGQSAGPPSANGNGQHLATGDADAGGELPATFGRFEIVRELGHGGLGVVFLARDPLLGRNVALKIPRADALLSRESRLRFSREAQAAARLTHPNLVPVYEIGEVGPVAYIASAYCGGPNLAAWLKTCEKRPAPKQAAWIVASLADAMHYAHSQGVLHRDLKPSNVLLEPHPPTAAFEEAANGLFPFTPKITDFGLAKIVERAEDATFTGAMLGTPAYMAPEQAEGRLDAIDPRTDVYGLGAILFELISGRAPFVGKSDADTVRRVLGDEAQFSRGQAATIPRDLGAIALKCLEKKPSRRYASCAALAADLRRFLAGESTEARPAGTSELLIKWARRRPATAALVAVSCLAAVTFVAGSTLFSWRLAAALGVSEERREEAVAARAEAESRRNEALRERDGNAELLYAAQMHQAFQALSHGNVSRVAKLLAKYDDGTPNAKLRNFEWYYLRRSLHGERLCLTGHNGEVYGVAFSPGGRLLASAGEDGTIRLWEPGTGNALRTIAAHGSCANDLDFSPDGQLLASGGCDGLVKLWDTATWHEIASFTGGSQSLMTTVAFSPDGHMLAAVNFRNGEVMIWDIANGTKVAQIKTRSAPVPYAVDAIAWSPNGRRFAISSSHRTLLVETVHWQTVSTLPASCAVAFSPDSRLLAAEDDGELRLFDAESAAERSATLIAHSRPQKLTFGTDGRQLYSTGNDGAVRIWQVTSDDRLATETRAAVTTPVERLLVGHTARVQGLTIARNDRTMATASFDGTVRLWDLAAKGGAVAVLRCSAVAVALSADLDRVITISVDGRLVTRDASSGGILDDCSIAQPEPIIGYRFSPDGEAFAIFTETPTQPVRTWTCDTHDPSTCRTVGGQLRDFRRVVFSPDGSLAAAADVGDVVYVWDHRTGAARFSLPIPADAHRITGLAISADCRKLAINVPVLQIIDMDTGARVEGESGAGICPSAFSPDGKTLAVSRSDGFASLIGCATGKVLHTMRLPGCGTFAFSPDGRALAAAAGDGRVILCHVATGQELAQFATIPGEIAALRFSQDGRSLGVAVLSEDHEAALYIWSSR